MSHYLNIHDVLDARRQAALKGQGEGPRTFVVGPTGAWRRPPPRCAVLCRACLRCAPHAARMGVAAPHRCQICRLFFLE